MNAICGHSLAVDRFGEVSKLKRNAPAGDNEIGFRRRVGYASEDDTDVIGQRYDNHRGHS